MADLYGPADYHGREQAAFFKVLRKHATIEELDLGNIRTTRFYNFVTDILYAFEDLDDCFPSLQRIKIGLDKHLDPKEIEDVRKVIMDWGPPNFKIEIKRHFS